MAASTYKHFCRSANTLTGPVSNPQTILTYIDLGDGKGAGAAGAYTAGETLDAVKIPGGSILAGAGIICLEEEGGTLTADLQTNGAEVDVTQIVNDFDLDVAPAVAGVAAEAKLGERFITDGVLQVLLNNNADAARFAVWATYIWDMDPLATVAAVDADA